MSYADCNAVGGMTAYNWEMDPKRLAFQFARYKHVAKILEGKRFVLEVGCSDGGGSRIVRQHVGNLHAIDIDEAAIEIANRNASDRWRVEFLAVDFMSTHRISGYDAAYSLDLFEHLEDCDEFVSRMAAAAPMCVIGTPSLESQAYASEISKREHVNCVSKARLREMMNRHFKHVIMLGMNDETLHTGFDAMTHYLLAIGCD